MAFVPLENGVKICLRQTMDGEQVCNVLHAVVPGGVTLAALIDIGEKIVIWADTFWKNAVTSIVSLDKIELTDIHVAGGTGIEFSVGLPIAGTLSGPLPNNVTIASKFSTGLTGRSNRGRAFLAGMAGGDFTSPNTITTTAQNIFTVMWQEFGNALADAAATWVVASFFSGGAPRIEGVANAIVGVTTNRTADSMRRRLPERGS